VYERLYSHVKGGRCASFMLCSAGGELIGPVRSSEETAAQDNQLSRSVSRDEAVRWPSR